MLYRDYIELLNSIPSDCEHLFGGTFNPNNGHWLSINAQAYPHVLFSASTEFDESDLQLKFIGVAFSRECEIEVKGNIKKAGVYTIVRLNESDPDLVRIFLRLLDESLCQDQRIHKNRDIRRQILDLSNLFSLVDHEVKDIVGLWGELFVIYNAKNLEGAVKSWCTHKMAKYDFLCETYALEIKSTLKSVRKHKFSLEQIRPTDNHDVFVVSLKLVELPSGQRISELMDSIYRAISDKELRRKFFSQCLMKGGRNIYGDDTKIGVLPGEGSAAIFDASCIPAPVIHSSDPIENVHFDVDLSEVQTVSEEHRNLLLGFT